MHVRNMGSFRQTMPYRRSYSKLICPNSHITPYMVAHVAKASHTWEPSLGFLNIPTLFYAHSRTTFSKGGSRNTHAGCVANGWRRARMVYPSHILQMTFCQWDFLLVYVWLAHTNMESNGLAQDFAQSSLVDPTWVSSLLP
jgi:hypothetical protein